MRLSCLREGPCSLSTSFVLNSSVPSATCFSMNCAIVMLPSLPKFETRVSAFTIEALRRGVLPLRKSPNRLFASSAFCSLAAASARDAAFSLWEMIALRSSYNSSFKAVWFANVFLCFLRKAFFTSLGSAFLRSLPYFAFSSSLSRCHSSAIGNTSAISFVPKLIAFCKYFSRANISSNELSACQCFRS